MDQLDRALLNIVQTEFPVASRPYEILGQMVGTNEEDAFQRIERLREEGIIRRLGGVFNSHKIGYFSTLCAAIVPEEKIDGIAEILNQHPGVTHNYLRDHRYNLWFTLIAPSKEEAEKTLSQWKKQTGLQEIYMLPAIRLFKIKVSFDFAKENSGLKPVQTVTDPKGKRNTLTGNGEVVKFTAGERALARILQDNLPHTKTPFAQIAEKLNQDEEEVLKTTQRMIDLGAIRRFGAVLRHQKAGFNANAMGVWQVPEECIEEVGQIMASFREVSHCYQRPTLPDWPYNVFTMIHGQTADDCRDVMKRISEATGIKEYSMLFSVKELKKCSMKYFMEESWDDLK